jgi:hypothetical protein
MQQTGFRTPPMRGHITKVVAKKYQEFTGNTKRPYMPLK